MASQLQAAAANREELERAQQQATERIAELERHLADTAGSRHELEAELEQLRARETRMPPPSSRSSPSRGTQPRHAPRRWSTTSTQLRAQTESETARAEALAAEVAELREHSSDQDEGLAAHVAELEESLRTATAERDAAVTRAAELEPELASLREQIRAAGTPAEGSAADVADLRRQLAARERRLAESVGEIAKLQPRAPRPAAARRAPLQLEETTTSVPEPKSEAAHVLFVPAATGYTLVERDGIAPEAGDIVELDGRALRRSPARPLAAAGPEAPLRLPRAGLTLLRPGLRRRLDHRFRLVALERLVRGGGVLDRLRLDHLGRDDGRAPLPRLPPSARDVAAARARSQAMRSSSSFAAAFSASARPSSV